MTNDIQKITQDLKISDEMSSFYKEKFDATEDDVKSMIDLPVMKMLTSKSENLPEGMKWKKDFEEGDYLHKNTQKVYKEPKIVVVGAGIGRLPTRDLKEMVDTFKHDGEVVIERDKQKITLTTMDDVVKQFTKYTEMVSGFLLEEKIPFVIYIKGVSLKPWWDFKKTITSLAKTNSYPKYAFQCKLGMTLRDGNVFKNNLVPEFQLDLSKKGQVQLITDKEFISKVANHAQEMKDMVDEYIKQQEQRVKDIVNGDILIGEEVTKPKEITASQSEYVAPEEVEDLPFDQ